MNALKYIPPFFKGGLGGISLSLLMAFVIACGGVSNLSVETHEVKRGEFVNSVTVTGELEAVNSKVIAAPPISWRFGALKIIKIVDDGKQVESDELLIQFDKGEVQKGINDAQSELEIAEAELRKTLANQKSEIESMAIDLEIAKINHEIAKLNVEQAVFKAEIDRKQLELKLEDATIALERAAQELENKKNIHREEVSKLELKVKQVQVKLSEANHTLSLLTVNAPGPGIAIIRRNYMTNNKFQVDDQAYPGWSMIGLPDLSQMKAKVQINEIDIAKIKLEQSAVIKLDAYPDTSFTGRIAEIATLARNKSRDVKVKVFDVTVLLDGQDDKLLPGMTVSCEIMVNKSADVLSIPNASVFEHEGKPIVYRRDGSSFEAHEVVLGDENDTHVIVAEGLEEGDEIALSNPTAVEALAQGKDTP